MKSLKRMFALSAGLCIAIAMVPGTALSQKAKKESGGMSAKQLHEMEKTGVRTPVGPLFAIQPVAGTSMFSIFLADGAGKTLTGSYTPYQLEVFIAVVQAAKEFALSEEAVGTKSTITTRLMDQHEWSLFVDVSKLGNKSQTFLSLISVYGRLTIPVGEITRGSKKEESPPLFDILTKLEAARDGTLQQLSPR